jgi:hypothetical protein
MRTYYILAFLISISLAYRCVTLVEKRHDPTSPSRSTKFTYGALARELLDSVENCIATNNPKGLMSFIEFPIEVNCFTNNQGGHRLSADEFMENIDLILNDQSLNGLRRAIKIPDFHEHPADSTFFFCEFKYSYDSTNEWVFRYVFRKGESGYKITTIACMQLDE